MRASHFVYESLLPAHAGVILMDVDAVVEDLTSPRARGDDLLRVQTLLNWTKVFGFSSLSTPEVALEIWHMHLAPASFPAERGR